MFFMTYLHAFVLSGHKDMHRCCEAREFSNAKECKAFKKQSDEYRSKVLSYVVILT